jgi:hypothetical protein
LEAGPLSPTSVQSIDLNRSVVGLGKGVFTFFAAET